MKNRVQYFTALAAFAFCVTGCQTIASDDMSVFNTPQLRSVPAGYETAGYLPAQNFIPASKMESQFHRVNATAYNDGYVNNYMIETPDKVFVVQGTEQALTRIHEIRATEELRRRTTAGAMASSAKDKSIDLVATPYRAARSIVDAGSEIKSTKEALLFVPSGAAEIAGDLATGLKEAVVTGARLTSGAAGADCSRMDCVKQLGKDLWSGGNSIVGKHGDARAIHAEMGTDPETQNKVLQREVDRLAYADAYTGAAFKFGLGNAGIQHISDWSRGVGYFKNFRFLSAYEDADKRKNQEKDLMRDWGVDQRAIDSFYNNSSYTTDLRTGIVSALSFLNNADIQRRLLHDAADAKTRYVAQSKFLTYDYLAYLTQQNQIAGFVVDAPAPIATTRDGRLILPFVSDYMQWTPEMASAVEHFSSLTQQGVGGSGAEIHVLGQTSPLFKSMSQTRGVRVIELAR